MSGSMLPDLPKPTWLITGSEAEEEAERVSNKFFSEVLTALGYPLETGFSSVDCFQLCRLEGGQTDHLMKILSDDHGQPLAGMMRWRDEHNWIYTSYAYYVDAEAALGIAKWNRERFADSSPEGGGGLEGY